MDFARLDDMHPGCQTRFGPNHEGSKHPFGGGLDLTSDNSYASLVNVSAAIGGVRVTPGSLEDSVL